MRLLGKLVYDAALRAFHSDATDQKETAAGDLREKPPRPAAVNRWSVVPERLLALPHPALSGQKKRTLRKEGGLPTPLIGLAWRRNLIVAAFILIDAEAIFFAERGIVVLADCTDLDLDRSIVRE